MTLQTAKATRGETPSSETVSKTLGLLEYFRTTPNLTASAVAQRSDLPLSTAYRLLQTLVRLRFLDYDSRSKTYKLGLKLLEYGHIVSLQLDLPQISLPILSSLVEQTGETVHLSMRDGDEGVFIAKVDAPHSIRMHTPLGRRVPLHAGASMKSIFANMGDDEIESYIERGCAIKVTPNTVTDRELILEEVRQIRQKGFAVSQGEQTQLAAGVSAPVYDHSGKVVAGLTISGPIQRMSVDKFDKLGQLVIQAAAVLSTRLGKINTSPE